VPAVTTERESGQISVLLVEDSPGDASLIQAYLEDGRFDVRWVQTLASAVAAPREHLDCVLLDLGLPDAFGLDALDAVRSGIGGVPVVVLTGRAEPELGIEAVRHGADDYLLKSDLPSRLLKRVVSYAVERSRAREAVRDGRAYAAAIVEAVAEGLVVHDLDGRAMTANAAAARILRLSPQEIADRHIDSAGWRVLRDDGTPYAVGEVPAARVLRTGRPETGVTVGVPRGDDVIWLEISAHPLLTAAGEMYGVVSSFRDVTERRRADAEIRFQAALLGAVGEAVVAADNLGTVTYWNAAAERLSGIPARDAAGRTVAALSRVSDFPVVVAGPPRVVPVARADGSVVHVHATTTLLAGGPGHPASTITVGTDITARARAEQALRQLSSIVEHTADAVFGKSLDGVIETWNRGAEILYGYRADEAIGRHASILVPDDRRDEIDEVLGEIAAERTVQDLETVRRRKDGSLVHVSLTVSPVYDAAGVLVGGASIARDASERHRMMSQLAQQALFDPLTGLPNRTLLGDRLTQAVAQGEREGTPVAVLFLDVDQFKLVNDAAGHLVGDELLVQVAARLRAAVRPHDTVARFGGDEFVVVCGDTDWEEAGHLAERLNGALAEPIDVDGRRHFVTASVGIAVSPPIEADALLKSADAAMYAAKATGRARARMFDAHLADLAGERLEITNDLRDALDKGLLALHYQPVVDVETGGLLGVEALVRWQHPTRGMLAPDSFVPVAEETGLVVALDRWVLRKACADGVVLRASGALPVAAYVAVNVSAHSLADPRLESAISEAVEASGLPYTALRIEITETGVMAEPEASAELLERLCAAGVTTAIDDFGTGYSSLAYLRRFPVASLKIDRSFVVNITDDPDDLAVTASIVDLARAVGVGVVAEGVETGEQLALLHRMGCRAAQGYLFAPAMPPGELVALLTRHSGRFPVPAGRGGFPLRADGAPAVTAEHGLLRIMALHRADASLNTIASALNTDGFRTPTGQRWHRSTVAQVVGSVAFPSLWGPESPGVPSLRDAADRTKAAE
jgi:diguanylate cyclase (GGDEF)-like protein/PAS domain S-box-containing protein